MALEMELMNELPEAIASAEIPTPEAGPLAGEPGIDPSVLAQLGMYI